MAEEFAEKKRTVHITLDDLPAGTKEHPYGLEGKASMKLPEGVSEKSVFSDVIRIGWPAFMEFMLIQLTGMFDQIQVGSIGPFAISAVGVATQPIFLLNTAFMSMNTGTMAMIARARGRGDRERAKMMLRQGLIITSCVSVLVMILGFLFSKQLIGLMGSDDPVVLEAGNTYLRIRMCAMIPFALTTTITSALRGVGNSRISLYYNATSNMVNIFFNWVLINGRLGFPRLEVRGAAIATCIGECVAFTIAMFVIFNKKNYVFVNFFKGAFKPQILAIRDIVHIGIPAALEQMVMRAGMIMFTRVVTSLGTDAYATHTICMNIQAFTFMNGQAFAVSSTSLVGQSLGKRRYDMAQAYSRRCQIVGFSVAAVFGIVFLFFGRNLVGLYTTQQDIIDAGAKILLMVALLQPFQSSQFILAGSMRGAGDTRAVAYITGFTMLILRPSAAYILVNFFGLGLTGAWIALKLDQGIRTLLVSMRYKSGKWKYTFVPVSE